jgi:hypothetical protein
MELFAYIDPGTGSLFIQATMGALLAIGVVFRSFLIRYVQKVKLIFSKGTSGEDK